MLVAATGTASEIDKAMDRFWDVTTSSDVSVEAMKHKWVNPTIQDELDLDEVLKGTKDMIMGGRMMLYHRRAIVDRIHTVYRDAKTSKEKLHWFMVMTTVTGNDKRLVAILRHPTPSYNDRKFRKEILDRMAREDTLDILFYLQSESDKNDLWELILKERKRIRDLL